MAYSPSLSSRDSLLLSLDVSSSDSCTVRRRASVSKASITIFFLPFLIPFSWKGKGSSTQCGLLSHYFSYSTLAIPRRFSCFMRQFRQHSVLCLRALPLKIFLHIEDDVLGGTIHSFSYSRHGSNRWFQRPTQLFSLAANSQQTPSNTRVHKYKNRICTLQSPKLHWPIIFII